MKGLKFGYIYKILATGNMFIPICVTGHDGNSVEAFVYYPNEGFKSFNMVIASGTFIKVCQHLVPVKEDFDATYKMLSASFFENLNSFLESKMNRYKGDTDKISMRRFNYCFYLREGIDQILRETYGCI